MKILSNEKEMTRLHNQHNSTVKPEYRCCLCQFSDWLATNGHEDEETGEMYAEVPRNEATCGCAVILDWSD